tara:strand:- start:313 stop:1494 length:1182 start_codon:yes stop_codon:yes gene_type:complete
MEPNKDNEDNTLTPFEKEEIKHYKTIYYSGKLENKLDITLEEYEKNNNIFSKNNRYIINKGDHISYRFNILEIIGKGTYGTVVLAKDHKRDIIRGIKIFNNLEYISKKKINSIFQHEINILNIMYEKFTHYLNKELFTLYSYDDIFRNHNYIVFKLYGKNLFQDRYRIIESTIYNKLTIIKEIFLALEFLSNSYPKIIHGDIKPENILFRNEDPYKFNIVLCDFGLSQIIEKEHKYITTDTLIQTRWYRSPDIFFNIPFNEKIDVWSAGCIIFELLEDRPLFKSKTDSDQIIYIHYILGYPTYTYIDRYQNIKQWYDRKYKLNNITNKNGKNMYPNTGHLILDKYFEFDLNNKTAQLKYHLIRLVYKCLEYNSQERISAKNAIKFIKSYCEFD